MKRKELLVILLISIMLTLMIGCAPAPSVPIINSFSAVPSTITEGESTILSWSVTDATSVTIDQGIGSKPLIGSIAVSPTVTTTYTLTATNSVGSVIATAVVIVNPIVPVYGSIDIKSTPTGAKVYLDGVDTGSITPIVLTNIEVGIHTIKLDKFHYKIREDNNVSVNAGATTYLNWSLTYAPTESITLQPGSEGKDSDVGETSPDTNSGSYTALWIGYTTSDKKWRAYLQFDLSPSPLPEGAIVTDADLKLYQYGSIGTGSFNVGLYKVTSYWGEYSITWNNQPNSSSEAEVSRTVYAGSTGWKTWYNIGDLVQGWLEGSITNYGMLLKATTDETSLTMIAKFRSSDATTNNPKLDIYYYIP